MPRRGIPRRGAFKNRAEGIVDMEAIYSSADLAFLDSSLKELQQRVQSLLRKNGVRLLMPLSSTRCVMRMLFSPIATVSGCMMGREKTI